MLEADKYLISTLQFLCVNLFLLFITLECYITLATEPCTEQYYVTLVHVNQCCIIHGDRIDHSQKLWTVKFFGTNFTSFILAVDSGDEDSHQYMYYIKGEGDKGNVVPYYLTSEEYNDRYLICCYQNSSLTLRNLPWNKVSVIHDQKRSLFFSTGHLQPFVEALALFTCFKSVINSSQLTVIELWEPFCKLEDQPSSYVHYLQNECAGNEFKCFSGECLPTTLHFDGKIDCIDGSDEKQFEDVQYTPYYKSYCVNESFHCYSGECISDDLRFDGKEDCHDGSDERQCIDPYYCGLNQFSCTAREYENITIRCNGNMDCHNGVDEENCTEVVVDEHGLYKCKGNVNKNIKNFELCDGIKSCEDGSDESNCAVGPTKYHYYARKNCSYKEVHCRNGKCIPKEKLLDGVKDCPDYSDEEFTYVETRLQYFHQRLCLSRQFHCYSGECIPEIYRFDGLIHCLDGSDEQQCTDPYYCGLKSFSCKVGEFIPITYRCDGYVDCQNGVDEENCTEAVRDEHSIYKCKNSPQNVMYIEVCDGIKQCIDGSDENNCTDIEYCRSGHLCGDGKCILQALKCNEQYDCADRSDEDGCIGSIVHAPNLEVLRIDYRKLMKTKFTTETQKSIKSISIKPTAHSNFNDELDFKRLIVKIVIFNDIVSLKLSGFLAHYSSHFDVSNISMISVKKLVLTNCELETFDIIPLHVFPSLLYLGLSQNKIREINPNLFLHLHSKMNYLDLSDVKLQSISIYISKGAEEIDLSNTSLSFDTINLQCGSEPCIDIVKLHPNKVDINLIQLDSLKYVKSIDIQDYTLDCSDCRLLESRVLSGNDSGITILLNGIQHIPICTAPEKYKGVSIREVNLRKLCQRLTDAFTNVVITASVITGLVLVISITLVYVYRFEIFYWIQYTKIKRRKMLLCQCDTEGYEYDAFVSYCSADRRWVWTVLRPALEDCPHAFRLCLHERDFLLGSHIFDNIENAFKTSRYCVMIISNDFVKSQWCKFELDTASFKLIHEKKEFLILVQLEELDLHEIPGHLKYLITTRTYLEWNIENFTQEELLERLKGALGKSIVESNRESRVADMMELQEMS